MKLPISGKRLQLRILEERDRAPFIELRRQSESFLKPWEPKPTPGVDPYSPELFKLLLDRANSDLYRLLVLEKTDESEILGLISFGQIIRGAFQNAHLGYWIGEPFARQGYMKEALRLALGYALLCFPGM